MPIYVFSCDKCQKTIEVLQGYYDERPKNHDDCGGKLTQKFGVPASYICPKTLGSLAEANTKGWSNDAKNHALEKQRTKKIREENHPSKRVVKKLPDGQTVVQKVRKKESHA